MNTEESVFYFFPFSFCDQNNKKKMPFIPRHKFSRWLSQKLSNIIKP